MCTTATENLTPDLDDLDPDVRLHVLNRLAERLSPAARARLRADAGRAIRRRARDNRPRRGRPLLTIRDREGTRHWYIDYGLEGWADLAGCGCELTVPDPPELLRYARDCPVTCPACKLLLMAAGRKPARKAAAVA